MASYSNPTRITYSFGAIVFTTTFVNAINAPGKATAGRVSDIHVRSTVLFTNVTTGALVNIGTVATPAKYAQLNCAATAAYAAVNGPAIFSDINFDRDGVTAIQVQVVAPTGGTPAGTGYLDVAMDWW